MYTLVFSIFTTLRGAANTPYTIRHFSNNPIPDSQGCLLRRHYHDGRFDDRQHPVPPS